MLGASRKPGPLPPGGRMPPSTAGWKPAATFIAVLLRCIHEVHSARFQGSFEGNGVAHGLLGNARRATAAAIISQRAHPNASRASVSAPIQAKRMSVWSAPGIHSGVPSNPEKRFSEAALGGRIHEAIVNYSHSALLSTKNECPNSDSHWEQGYGNLAPCIHPQQSAVGSVGPWHLVPV